MHMDFFRTGTAGYPTPTTPPPYNQGNFWFGGAGNEAGPLPAANPADPDLTQVLAYADVLAPAGKQFEYRIASPWNGQDNGIRFVGTGTGGWQTVGGTLASGTPMGSFDTLAPNVDMIVVFGSPAQGPMTWDSGGAFGSTPAVLRWDNLTLTAASASWQGTSGGSWATNSNWSPAAPSGRNAVATFGPSAGAQTITLDSPVPAPDGDAPPRYSYYAGGVVFDSAAGSYTLAGSEPLVIDTTAANGVDLSGPNGNISVLAGSHTISAPLRFNRTTNVTVGAGNNLTVTSDQTAQAGAGIIKSGTGALEMKHARATSLAVNEGVLKITGSGGAPTGLSYVGTLSIAPAARLDLTDNKLITNDAPGTPTGGVYDGVQREVQRARAGNAWNTPGLTTSMADAKTGKTTIGVSTGKQIRNLGPTQTSLWGGQTITATSTLAMYTYAGDANLDGQIDAGDYGIIDNFVQVSGASGYGNGDFNYDGFIDAGDYGIIDNNIQAQGTPFPTSGSVDSTGLASVTAVPEPAACGFAMALAAAALIRRRRRDRFVAG
jgi:hypothetical protein